MATLSTLNVGDTARFSARSNPFKVLWRSWSGNNLEVEYLHSGTRRWFSGQKEIYVPPAPFKMSFRTFMMKLDGKKPEALPAPRFALPRSYTESVMIEALEEFVAHKYPSTRFDTAFTWNTAIEDYDDDYWSLLFYDPGVLDRETYKLGCEILTDWAVQLKVLKDSERKKFLEKVFNQADQFFDDIEEESVPW